VPISRYMAMASVMSEALGRLDAAIHGQYHCQAL
jgi:hypothetical protein